jgi:hypothetical protein
MNVRLTGLWGIVAALVIVGAVILGTAQLAAALTHSASAPLSDAQNYVTTLTALPPVSGDGFGEAVAVDGATAIVGASGPLVGSPPRSEAAFITDSVAMSGQAYVFTKSAPGWSTPVTLPAPGTDPLGGFGSAVALSGDTAVVAAPFSYTGMGAVCVYTRTGGVWSASTTLGPPNPEIFADFGRAVAISGNTLIVGAPGVTVGGVSQAGAAYVFTRSGFAWSAPVTLTAPTPAMFALFGSAVDISGDTAIVGAAGEADFAGAAYGFTRSGGTWGAPTKLTEPTPVVGHEFGSAVAIQGGTAVVGAPAMMAGNSSPRSSVAVPLTGVRGEVYVYAVSGGAWSQPVTLTAPTPTPVLAPPAPDIFVIVSSAFGRSVDVWGDTVLVGGGGGPFRFSPPSGIAQVLPQPNSAYLFGRAGTGWSAPVTITAVGSDPNSDFGSAVSLAQDSALVGAPGFGGPQAPARVTAQGSRPATGAAFVFDLLEPSAPSNFQANPGNGKIGLVWTNASSDFAATRIFRSTGGYAAGPSLEESRRRSTRRAAVVQTQIYEGTGHFFADSPLTNGTTYYYTAFSRDPEGRWSAAAHATAKAGIQSGADHVLVTQFSVTQPSPGSPFVVTGDLSPKHLVSVTLTLYFCHQVNGKWVHYSVHPKVKLKPKATRWRVRVKLPSSGKWCVRAWHKDPWNRGIWSNRKFFTVTWDRW